MDSDLPLTQFFRSMRTRTIRSLHNIWSVIKPPLNWTIINVVYEDFADLTVKIFTLYFLQVLNSY